MKLLVIECSSPGPQERAETKKVAWGKKTKKKNIFTLREGTEFLGVEGLQILVIHKIHLLKFIQSLCSLEIFFVY